MMNASNVPSFYRGYIELVKEGKLVPLLVSSRDHFIALCEDLSEQQGNYKYAPDKWSIKDIILHLIDSERIFVYRALRFARNDQTELSGYEHNDYVSEAKADTRTINDLLVEFSNVRASTIDMFSSFDEDIQARKGTSNGVEMTVETIGYIISGHTMHHMNIIKERYLA